MRIGLFSDSHYCMERCMEGTRMCYLSLEKIRQAMENFVKNEVDLVMCQGDLVDAGADVEVSKKCLAQLLNEIESYQIPFLFVVGNHDFNVVTLEELKEISGTVPPMKLDIGKCRIVCLDANYRSDHSHYDPSGYDWKDTNIPAWQLDYLINCLKETEKDCIVAVHQPIDSTPAEMHRVNNAEEVRRVLEVSGKVKLVIQGHLHNYADVVENGIRYITLAGMCEGDHNCYMILTKENESNYWNVQQCS